ncbi:putative sensor histidine kinase with a Response regulator receiver domain [Bradyrhizobium sp. ORS 278]|uniref:ATP-binding protein n=1 Tax=Bradyrhizobium sp. (strain ORS 278) TaxID=114615 RepID=UPI0001507B31|nr:ATP-binding protein [Bradyrhizobium sp. ORS 278]CAL74199.1 putative sensor histidine kinase with a Response regulator receiver domain [Bradyrhizobium sp. ORS 278]
MQTAQRKSLTMLRWMMVASLALPIALFLVAAYVSYGATTDEADREIRRSLDVVHEHALKVFETIERSLSEIDEIVRDLSDSDIKTREQALHVRLRQLSDSLPQMKSAWVFDANGRPLVNSLIYPAPEVSFLDRDYFSAHVKDSIGTFIGAPLTPRSPYPGAAFFSVSRRRQSDDGSFTGIIQASVLPDYFEHFYARIGRAPGSYFALKRFDGLTLARFPAAERSAGPAPNDIPAGAADTEQLVTETSRRDGIERRVGYQRLPGYPVYVAAGLETATIRNRWLGTMSRHLIFGIPATALLVVFLTLARRRTERFYIEAARRLEAEDALKHGQRMEALGQLTGGVAHDFNNLLTVIRASADLLRRPNLPDERRQRYIDAISDTVARASKLTSQLLAFARRQTLKPEVFDIGRSVVTLRDMTKTLVGSRIEIVTSVPDEPCYVNADAGQFETALINMAVNARDAMAGQGLLSITVVPAPDLPTPVAPHDRPPLGYVAIAVQDTGVGIPQEQVGRIFEPFFTTKTIGQGTGLGLSQVFGFAKQSGGEIGVVSEVGRGATFTLYLPRVAPMQDQHHAAPGHAVPITGRGMSVLVVEDNIDVGRSATEALAELGYLTTLVDNAKDALEELIDGASRFDVVFTDVVMPGMTGLELAEEIRRLELNIPVVLASGYSHVLAQQGTNGFELLRKPYSIEELSRVLHKVVPVPLYGAPPVAPNSEVR